VTEALGDKAKRVDLRPGRSHRHRHRRQLLEAAARSCATIPAASFEQLIDVCGVDYSAYKDGDWDGLRYAWSRTCCRSA
jgi:NADH-quinone oxidoreductase subunit C